MFHFYKIFFVFAAVFLLSACGQEKSSDQTDQKENKLKVYTTIYPLTFFTEEIGKEFVDAESILPAGVEEHTYEPTAKTIIDIANGDLFMYNGLGLEPFGEKVKESMKKENVRVVEMGKKIDLDAYNHSDIPHKEANGHEHADEESHQEPMDEESHDEHNHEHGGTDPHIWLDPALAVQMAEVIKEELSALDPEHKQAFSKNLEELKSKLTKVDGEFHEMAENAVRKEFLVSHAAFGYWEKEYGLEQISIAGLSPENEPSQKQLKEMIETARKHQIKYVIFEQNITPKVAKVVQKELKAEALKIHNLSVLTEEDEEKGEDYFSLMEQNIQTLKQATGN